MSWSRVSCSFCRHLSVSANGPARSAIVRQNPSTFTLGTLSAAIQTDVASRAALRGANMSNLPGRCGRQFHQGVEHRAQMHGRLYDVDVFVAAGVRLGGKNRAAVHTLEVAIRELVAVLGTWRLLVVLAQMPPRKFSDP